jgi:hypothetical protein
VDSAAFSIVQLTFLMVFVAYFYSKAGLSTSWWWRYSYSIVANFGAGFTLYFGFLISRIVFEYFVRDIAVHYNPWGRAVALVWFLPCIGIEQSSTAFMTLRRPLLVQLSLANK